MFNKIKYPLPSEYAALCQRPALDQSSLDALISDVFKQVGDKGDQALREYTAYFEKREIHAILYQPEEIAALAEQTSPSLQQAIDHAYANIYAFHEAQKLVPQKIEVNPGVICWQKATGIDKVGIYIPGGSAPLFSTVLMLAIPAKIAQCKEVVLCTPAVHPAIFYAAKLCGVTKMAKVGGSQAIAALTLGTESVPAVYKIFGPGNQYVTAAKMYSNRLGTAIDMPAGPSEVAVYADFSANPAYIASDLLSQAEHGPDSQVVLISSSEEILDQTITQIQIQLESLPRKDLAQKALENSTFILVKTEAEAIDYLNIYAAEHLILACESPEKVSDSIHNAGSIFLGHYTPESAGDYASGTNHTLPTNGFARAYSGVNLDSFTKKITLQAISKQGLRQLGPTIVEMAEAESLQAHANAVKIRLND
jgi:histidinol dehydrogenase